jgi:acetolactate synthase-1/2/3 large subunit
VDVVATMKPLTKLSRQIVSASMIPTLVREAFRVAEEERPGPVHLELPEDIAAESCEDVALIAPHPVELPLAGTQALDRAAQLIIRAERPLAMLGAAASRPRSTADIAQFVLRTRIPYFTTQMGKGTVPGGTELYMGTAALSERDYVHEAIDRADLIITIGHDTVEKPPFIMGPDGPQVVHIGYQPASVEQVYFPQTEVVGDIGPTLRLLADRVEGIIPHASALLPLRADILAHIADRDTEQRFTPQRLVHDIRQVMPSDGIVALDNGMYKIWFARNYRTRVANTLLLDNALATMGAGLPSAMMAAMLYPKRRVMAVCGDGGFMMNSQEMETAVRLKLSLVVLVIEDGAYGMIRWKQSVDRFPDFGMTLAIPTLRSMPRRMVPVGPGFSPSAISFRRCRTHSAAVACTSLPYRSIIPRTNVFWLRSCARGLRRRPSPHHHDVTRTRTRRRTRRRTASRVTTLRQPSATATGRGNRSCRCQEPESVECPERCECCAGRIIQPPGWSC